MCMTSETTHVRIYKADNKRLWDLVNSEKRTMPDVIKYLLDKEEIP